MQSDTVLTILVFEQINDDCNIQSDVSILKNASGNDIHEFILMLYRIGVIHGSIKIYTLNSEATQNHNDLAAMYGY